MGKGVHEASGLGSSWKNASNQKLHIQVRLIKCMHNWLNTGEQKEKINPQMPSACPLCTTEKETWSHLLKCQPPEAQNSRLAAFDTLKSALYNEKTAPIVKQVILYKIQQWCGYNTVVPKS